MVASRKYGKKGLMVLNRWDQTGASEYDHTLPIAVLDIAPLLRVHGYEVDCCYVEDLPEVVMGKYDWVGYSSLFGDCSLVQLTLKKLRALFPDSEIFMGGKSVHTLPASFVMTLREEGYTLVTESAEEFFLGYPVAAVEDYPCWQRRDFETLKLVDVVRSCNVMSTRGCPYHCHFCHNSEPRIHYFSGERTAANIDLLFSLGRSYINICDDIFTLKAEHMIAVYEACKRRGIPVEGRIRFFTHINHITAKTASVMALFQPRQVAIGLESGSEQMLKNMGKGFSPAKALERIKLLRNNIERIQALFLLGFPGETRESLEETRLFARRIAPYTAIFSCQIYQPVRNTVGYEMTEESGALKPFRQLNGMEGNYYIGEHVTYEMLVEYRDKILHAGN